MKLIVGLGNPGPKYTMTRHNIGFLAIDALVAAFGGTPYKQEHKSFTSKIHLGPESVLLAQPQTFMNLSGEAVRSLIDYYNIDPVEDLLVMHDEVDLLPFEMRFQKARGHGGQNGVRNIHQHLGNNNYARLRLGVGRPTRGDVANYVLSPFRSEEQTELNDFLEDVVTAVEAYITEGLGKASSQFNQKRNS